MLAPLKNAEWTPRLRNSKIENQPKPFIFLFSWYLHGRDGGRETGVLKQRGNHAYHRAAGLNKALISAWISSLTTKTNYQCLSTSPTMFLGVDWGGVDLIRPTEHTHTPMAPPVVT